MRMTSARATAAPLAALLVSGCLGGLLGGGKPAQMYRFGTSAPLAPDGPAPAAARIVQLSPVQFAGGIDTDRMLASRGAETLYIKGARWAAPASELFTAALQDSLRRLAPDVAVMSRRDGAPTAQVLRVSVSRFEAHYAGAEKDAAPEIRIAGLAVLLDPKGDPAGERYLFTATQPAASGRIGDIVAAFDAADTRAVEAVAGWVETRRAPAR